MRRTAAAMTDPVVPRATHEPAPLRRGLAVLPWIPAARVLAAGRLARHLATSQPVQAAQAGAALPLVAFDPALVAEASDIALAMGRQWLQLQSAWLDGLDEIAREMAEVHDANTVSKFVDQEVNLVEQGVALVNTQATATVRLLENWQVGVAWWLTRRLLPDAPPPG